jgi:hypothetical protein
MRITSPARTIVDAAEAGTDPSVIVEAVDRALEEGLFVADELRRTTEGRSERVRKLIERAIEEAGRHAPVR